MGLWLGQNAQLVLIVIQFCSSPPLVPRDLVLPGNLTMTSRILLREISVPPGPAAVQFHKKHAEAYINYKLVGLFDQTSY